MKEVVREMTQKAGQKCTAIRRALVPATLAEAAEAAIVARLRKITMGDPRAEGVRMGALAGLQQREDVRANVERLKQETRVAFRGNDIASTGAFMSPVLLRCDSPSTATIVHEVECSAQSRP